jgi:hypothetical protein
MTDEVKRICRRWLWSSAIGAIIGFLLAYGLSEAPQGASGLLVAALPIAAVALAQVVTLYRYRPVSDMALLWLLVTPLFILVAYVLGLVGFSGYRHVPSYREYATVIGIVTTPFLLILGWIQGAILKRWVGRAPSWPLITAVGNIVALVSVVLLAWLFEASGVTNLAAQDRLMAGVFAPLMFVLSAFQVISLKNVALQEPSPRTA